MSATRASSRFHRRSFQPLAAAIFLALTFLLLAAALPAAAATITVDTTVDDDKFGGDSLCSLREAIISVNSGFDRGDCVADVSTNAYGVNDQINVPAGVYTLTELETDNGLRDLDVKATVVISGAGTDETIVQANGVPPSDGASTFSRVFEVDASDAEIRDMTIRYGKMAGIGDGPESKDGAGVRINGSLWLTRVVIASNWMTATSPNSDGGGIYNNGVVTVADSTLRHNQAGRGAAIYNEAGKSLTVRASTVHTNTSTDDGGGLYTRGQAWVENSTFSENLASQSGGGMRAHEGALAVVHTSVISNAVLANSDTVGVYQSGGSVVLTNTLVAHNRRGDNKLRNCVGIDPGEADADNMADDATCGSATNAGGALLVGPLADNGGPTWTHDLPVGSAAINHVLAANCAAAVDQRGVTRPQAGTCDAGAVEKEAKNLTTDIKQTSTAGSVFKSGLPFVTGTYSLNLTLLNTGTSSLDNLFFVVQPSWNNANVLVNRDAGSPPSEGAIKTVANASLPGGDAWDPAESHTELFVLGLNAPSYKVILNLYTWGLSGADGGAEPNLVGRFEIDLDPANLKTLDHQIFIPLLTR